MTWHIKKPDGSVYGPVELPVLKTWAADGRVAPEDQVSPDQQSWMPAPDLTDLSMDWLVHLGNGSSYGPVHLLALREALSAGTLSLQARLIHKSTRESFLARDALLQSLLEYTHHLEELTAGLPLPQALERKTADFAPFPLNSSEPEASQTLINSYAVLSNNYDRLLEKLREKSAQLQQEIELRMQLQAESDQRSRSLEDLVRTEQEKVLEARQRLAETEEQHMQLVKSYREMNDRYIRLRQQQEQTTGRALPPTAGKSPAEPDRRNRRTA